MLLEPRAGDQRVAALVAGSIEQRRRLVALVDDRGPQPAVERGGDGALVARVDVERVGQ